MGFTIGLVLGTLLLALVLWLNGRKVVVRWYEWLLGALGAVLLLWAVNDYFASVAERNEYAGLMLLWMLGVPGLLLLGLGVFLPWRRRHPHALRLKWPKLSLKRARGFKASEADLAR